MTDTEETPPIVQEKKPRKKRAPLTEEQKEALRERLKVGRATALKNRQKKALVKKALKKDKEEADDKIIAERILKDKKGNHEETFKNMTDQINELREELTKIKSQPKKQEKNIQVEVIKETENEIMEFDKEEKRLTEKPKPKETPEESFKTMMKPVPTEEPQKKPEPKIPQMTTYSVKGRRKRGYY
jgi:hypothetical protein